MVCRVSGFRTWWFQSGGFGLGLRARGFKTTVFDGLVIWWPCSLDRLFGVWDSRLNISGLTSGLYSRSLPHALVGWSKHGATLCGASTRKDQLSKIRAFKSLRLLWDA